MKPLVTSSAKKRDKHIHTCAQFTFSTLMQSGTQTQRKVLPKGDWLFPHSLVQSRQYLKCQLEADNFALQISSEIILDCVKVMTKANPGCFHVTAHHKIVLTLLSDKLHTKKHDGGLHSPQQGYWQCLPCLGL